MANDMDIEIGVKFNDGGSDKKIGDIKEGLKKTDVAAKSLKAQLREITNELNSMADAGETNSAEFRRLQAEAGRLSDQIGDTRAEIDAMAGSTVERLGKGLSKALQVGIAGFQAVQGSMAMIGIEGEQAQEVMMKLQGAMAISSAITEFGQLSDTLSVLKGSFSGLLAPIGAFIFGTEAAAVAEGGLTVATGGASAALNVFKGALIATGIGAIIVAIGLLITNFDLVSEAVVKASGYVIKAYDYFDNLGAGIKVLIAIFFPFIGIIYGAIKALEYFNIIDTKTERDKKERHEKNMKRVDAELKKQEEIREARDRAFTKSQSQAQMAIDLAKAEGKETTNLEINKITASINYQKEKQKELRQEFAMIKLLSESNKFYKDYFGAEKMKELSTGLDELDASIANSQNQIKILKAEAKNQTGTNKKDDKTELEAVKKAIEDAEKALLDSKKTALQKSIDDITAYYDEQIRLANKHKLDTKILEKEKDREINKARKDDADSNVHINTKTAAEIMSVIVKKKTDELQVTKDGNDKITKSNKETTDKELQNQQSLNQSRLRMTGEAFTAIAGIIESFSTMDEENAKKQFKISKAFNLAAATTNTALAVTAALTAGGNPIKLATGAQFVEAGIAAATGLANIIKISSTQFGGGGGALPGPGSPPPVPSFNPSTFYGLGQTTPSQNQNTGDSRVYVLEHDITKVQRRVSTIERRSTLGA